MSDHNSSKFETVASDQRESSIIGEFWYFLRQTKKWWLLPIVLILVLVGGFMLLSSSAIAPFIYTLF